MNKEIEKRLTDLDLWMQTFSARDARHIEIIQDLQSKVAELEKKVGEQK